ISTPAVTWSVTGPGTIDATGLYQAPATGSGVATITASSGSSAASASVTVQPASFTSNADIGSPAIAGSSSCSNGVYTVQAGGTDIRYSADQFQYVYTNFTGDGTI